MGRAASGRSVTRAGADGFEALALAPGATETTLRVNRRPDRDARVHLRFGTLTLRRPQRSTRTPDGLTVQGVEGVERQPPADAAPSHGRLLTSLPLETPEQAQPIVTCYPDRWRIERFHYPLNRGGKLQASPWRTQARLERWRAV